MPKLGKKDIEHVAKLAKLTLTPSDLEKYTSELGRVIDYVSALDEVNTSGVEPTSQTTGLESVYREDRVKSDESLSQEGALSGTDKGHNGYFVVPGILEEKNDK